MIAGKERGTDLDYNGAWRCLIRADLHKASHHMLRFFDHWHKVNEAKEQALEVVSHFGVTSTA